MPPGRPGPQLLPLAGVRRIMRMFALSCRHRLWTAWLLAAAMLLAAFAPVLAQASQARRGADMSLSPVCVGGMLKWVDVATGQVKDGQGDPSLGEHLERCPFCTTHSAVALPRADVRQDFSSVASHEAPPLFFHAPRPLFAWLRAPSRAPPLPA